MKNILAVLLIIASVGIFYVLIGPTYAEIQTSRTEKARYDKAMGDSEALQERQAIIGSKYNEMSPSDVEKLEKMIPDSIDNIRLIIEIDKIAQKYNMSLKDARIAEKKTEADSLQAALAASSGMSTLYGVGELSFGVSGTYEAYIAFIKDLEKSLRLIDITSITVAAGEAPVAGDMQVYNFTTMFKTYWLNK